MYAPLDSFLFVAALLLATGAPLATLLAELERWPVDYRPIAQA